MLNAALNAWRLPDLRKKIVFTFAMLIVFRFVAHVPVPGVDVESLQRLFQSNQLLGMLDLFSGGAMRNLSVASMGVYPYITASIIMQLMVPVIPALEGLSKEGELGRQKINQYTHYLTVPLAFLSAFGQLLLFQSQGVLQNIGLSGPQLLPTLAMLFSMTAGTVFLVWIGELITENGIGNGVSVIIFGGIVSGLPGLVGQSMIGFTTGNPGSIITFMVLGLLIVAAIVFFQEAQRRIPVQYTRSLFRGGRMYRQSGASHIPLRVNSAGMIPLIFAGSIMILPGTLAGYIATSEVEWVSNAARFMRGIFDATAPVYWILYGLLVVGFTFFYTLVIFQQQNLSENLQKNGGFIPGIRPGKPTAEYLNQVILRITWAGAMFLGLIAVMPFLGQIITGQQSLQVESTGMLIVAGVVLDTMRQLESQLMMRNYEGFIH